MPLSSGSSAVEKIKVPWDITLVRPVTLRYMPFDVLAFVRTPDCDDSHISCIAGKLVFLNLFAALFNAACNDSCIL